MNYLKPFLTSIFLIVLLLNCFGQTSDFSSYLRHEFSNTTLSIFDENENEITVTPYTNEIVQVSYNLNVLIKDTTSSTILEKDINLNVELNDNENNLELLFSNNSISISKENLEISFGKNGSELLSESEIIISDSGSMLSFNVDAEEKFYGTGSRAIPMNRNNRFLTIYNQARYGYGNGADALNITIPFVISSKNYGLFFDNHQPAYLDINSSNNNTLSHLVEGGPDVYWVILDNSYEEIIQLFTKLTGFQPLPPRWSLGYIQSRFGYQSENAARNMVDLMLENNFPIDAIVLDLYWFGGTSAMGNLNWDYSEFPTPEDMMSDFKEDGIETILITEPYFIQNTTNYTALDTLGYFGKNENDETYVLNEFWAGTAALLDIYNEDAQDWFWDFYEDRQNEGASGWWCDLGEPELHPWEMVHTGGTAFELHNLYSMKWAEMIYKKTLDFYPDRRMFNLIRSGYAGMQRYGTFPWSGDVQRTFGGLEAQIPIMLGTAACGIGYMHSDLGGFTGYLSDNLYIRWMQFGTFTPIMRPHGVGDPPEPVFYETDVQNIIRKFSELRHQLMPYIYTLAYENSNNGKPIVNPIIAIDNSTSAEEHIDTEFLYGDNFLIAPILESESTNREVYFPEGKWINFWNDRSYGNQETKNIEAPIDEIPVFVKAGSIIPMAKNFLTMKDYSTDSLEIHCYPDNSVISTDYQMYNDDGISKDYENGQFEILDFATNYQDSEIKISFGKLGLYEEFEGDRVMEFIVHRSDLSGDVYYNDIQLTASTVNEYQSNQSTYYFNEDENLLYVKVNWDHENSTIRIEDFNIAVSNKTILNSEPEVYLYPNPVANELSVHISQLLTHEFSIEIFNSMGQLKFKHEYQNKENVFFEKLNLEAFEPGLYFISIRSNKQSKTHKILKK